MTFFDENMQSHDVTMQELQLAAQEQYNYSLIGEEPGESATFKYADDYCEYALD